MGQWITARLVTLTRVYFSFLLGWAIVHVVVSDGWWPMLIVNAVALYYFVPLPLALGVALVARRRDLWLGLAFGVGLWALLYGGLFLPRRLRFPATADGPTLTVMTYNVLTFNQHPAGVVAAIRLGDADVVALQELSPPMAGAIETELADAYPYQMLDPQAGYDGMGLISRYPLTPVDETVPALLLGTPQLATLDFEGTRVTVLHFHAHPPTYVSVPGEGISVSEWEARVLVDYLARHSGPLLLPTDLNATDQGTAYRLITRTLDDAWRQAGWGPGHTYPGASQSGDGSRLRVLGVLVPNWLARIDYVFVSEHWQTVTAHIGPWDGVSDHRPLVVTVQLVE